MDRPELIEQTLLLDLETTRAGKIRQIGAVLNGEIFEEVKHPRARRTLEALDRFAESATYVLGHNLLGHDFPVLNASVPWLGLLKKPVIDTLYLSPLAFPQNPYHRLVKDYKLVKTAINSPVADAKLAASVFADQWQSFTTLAERNPVILDFYRFCFQDSVFNGFSGMGQAAVFLNLTKAVIAGPQEALDCFVALTAGKVCDHVARQVLPDYLADSVKRPAAAYCLA